MPAARGTLDVTTEAAPPFLEQDGIELHRSMVHEDEGECSCVLEYEYR